MPNSRGRNGKYPPEDPPPYSAKKLAEDPWKVALPELNDGPRWDEMTASQHLWKITCLIFRVILLLVMLYLFVCSLSFLSSAFRLIGGFTAGSILSNYTLLGNPVAALMIGVIVTVLVQSSSTSTSIIVAMVGAGLIEVHAAIPVVMGANIGTSVTNTIVAMGQAKNKDEFRRAFGGATVHDMFNWLSVIVLLPLEVVTGYLEKISSLMVTSIESGSEVEIQILKAITDPFTKWVIQIDKTVITKVAEGIIDLNDVNATVPRILKVCEEEFIEDCDSSKFHWFWRVQFSDTVAGLIVLIASVLLLLICLIVIVKTLHSLLRGSIARIVHKVVNADLPGCAAYFTGYIAILAGAGCTFVVQSSSIFTSAITPLVGIGVITLERMYPLTLGANIGTTATSILAAFAVDGGLKDALQLAFCHLLFNISGILIWYPIPYIRFPIPLARGLGNTTAKYRWFAMFYLIMAFFLVPAAVFGLSIANDDGIVLMVVGIPILLILIIIVVINILQHKWPELIANSPVRDWEWLPKPFHSLGWWDAKLTYVCICCKRDELNDEIMSEVAVVPEPEAFKNPAFEEKS